MISPTQTLTTDNFTHPPAQGKKKNSKVKLFVHSDSQEKNSLNYSRTEIINGKNQMIGSIVINNDIDNYLICSINNIDDIFLTGLTNNVRIMNINSSGLFINKVLSNINNNQLIVRGQI